MKNTSDIKEEHFEIALSSMILTCILIFSRYDEIVFTDSEIRYLKRNKTIKAVKWDDYNNVNFKRGHQGNVVVILNNTSCGNGPEAGERNGDNEYHLLFSWWFLATKKGKELVEFLENRYGVSFKV